MSTKVITFDIDEQAELNLRKQYRGSTDYRIMPIIACSQCKYKRAKTAAHFYCGLKNSVKKLSPRELYMVLPDDCPLKKAKPEHMPEKELKDESEKHPRAE
jgi:hypothetical protein